LKPSTVSHWQQSGAFVLLQAFPAADPALFTMPDIAAGFPECGDCRTPYPTRLAGFVESFVTATAAPDLSINPKKMLRVNAQVSRAAVRACMGSWCRACEVWNKQDKEEGSCGKPNAGRSYS
jgi:hypothetical protein